MAQAEKMHLISAAINSAQIAAAHTCSQSSEVCVFAVKMSDDIFEEYFSDDTSCENTDNCWCIESASLNKLIQDNKIAISLLTVQDTYNPYLRIFYLNHLSDQYYNKPYDDSMFESAKRITQRFDYIDDIYDYGKIDEIKLNT